MTQPVVQLRRRGFGETMRRDAWWLPPLGVFTVLSSFLLYGHSPHAWFTRAPRWLAAISPALLILPFPGGFRFTCYYYRGAYYKAFWSDPPSCAVGEPRKSYLGENSFPLIIQNIHRYFMYAAVIFLFLLAHDVWKAMWFDGKFGIGVGTLILAANV